MYLDQFDHEDELLAPDSNAETVFRAIGIIIALAGVMFFLGLLNLGA